MSSFEFLSVLISVVVGLGMANMLTGVGRLLHKRRTISFSLVHLAWSTFVFLMMVVYWWTVVFGWRDWEHWNIFLFLFILSYGVLLFLLSAILYPSEIPESWDLFDHFLDMRQWFFGIFVLWLLAEFADTYFKGHLDDFSVLYFILMSTWLVCALSGWVSTNRKTHTVISIVVVVTLFSWVGYQLGDLNW